MTLRNLRLVTGLVLMLFVTGHMANLMLGMHSLEAMERWRPWLMGPWRSVLGQGLLVCSALVHLALGVYAITARRSLAMSKTDVVQLCLGIATPPLLLNHAIVMHMAGEVTPHFDATFGQMLAVYWSFSPGYALQQLLVVMVVWIHAASLASFSRTSLPASAKPINASTGTANSTGSTRPPMRFQTGFSTSHEYRPTAAWIQTAITTSSCCRA